jgi:hypothetical protein
MVNNTKMSMAALAVVVGSGPSMVMADDKAEGFIEGSSLTVLNRNFYFNRDHRNGQSSPTGNGYSETWAHAVISKVRIRVYPRHCRRRCRCVCDDRLEARHR